MPVDSDLALKDDKPMPAVSYLDAVRGVSMMGSDTSLRKILSTVHASMSASLPDITQALAQADVPRANALLHAMKGYLPIFAADALANEVAEVEFLSKTGTADVVAPRYALLAPKLAQLQDEIGRYLATT